MKKIILFLIIVSALFLASCTTANTTTGNTVANEGFVKIPLADISEEMQMYSYNVNGVDVNYFAVKGSDGEIRTAFDACDVCGGHKGYRQEGDQVVCNNCSNRFDIDDIGSKNAPGGCWPSYLGYEIDGDNVLISIKEISDGRYRFA